MYLYSVIHENDLDEVLRVGFGASRKCLGDPHSHQPVWLTEEPAPIVLSPADVGLFRYLHPGQEPSSNFDGHAVFGYPGAMRIKVRVRHADQVRDWTYPSIGDVNLQEKILKAVVATGDGFTSTWLVAKSPISARQIVGVCKWSEDDQEWESLPTGRHLVLHKDQGRQRNALRLAFAA